MIKRIIPSSKEEIPVLGLGTWKTFDVNSDREKENLKNVLYKLHEGGGRLIDSSPMYGQSERVIGELTSIMEEKDDFFYATKVWTSGLQNGIRQMVASLQRMNRKSMDLMQIHNLVDWKTHLPQLHRWKDEGKIRYVGITHYSDSSHEELEKIIRAEKVDFVQFNYSIFSRHAEKRLLDAAAGMGVATLINMPFVEGSIFNRVKGKELPSWAHQLNIDSWSVYFLKYIISHPSVTCVIPATSDPSHAAANLKAVFGVMPDSAMRRKMTDYVDVL